MGIIKTKQLEQLGFKNNLTKSLIINTVKQHLKREDSNQILNILNQLQQNPLGFVEDPIFQQIALSMLEIEEDKDFQVFDMVDKKDYKIFGKQHIEPEAIRQMDIAMSLPITSKGALMPDAHGGYGLPIGGVLACNNAVIPYAVGMDIGCRMALSIIDESEKYFKSHHYQMELAIRNHTHFGMEGGLEYKQEHAIIEDSRFSNTNLLKKLRGKAIRQLGTSGGGNHFVEFGLIEILPHNDLNLKPGNYVALLTHSGSRGFGANIAMHYTQIAQNQCKLPNHAKNLAWLDLNAEAGQEYWMSMELAGDYAKACHDQIHKNLVKSLGVTVIKHVDNHHNFAWKEQLEDGTPIITHRKGATPAHKGTFGIIPGNMIDPAYLVMGKGDPSSINSAAHGAGRAMSRSQTKLRITNSELKKTLAKQNVTLIGGSVEESPLAYKDITQVMSAQKDLVSIQGTFLPKIVRMYKE